MSRGGNVGHLLEQVDVFRAARKLEVANQHAEGGPAKGAVLFLVDLLEQCTLVKFRGRLHVPDKILPGGIEHLNLHVAAGLALVDQVFQASPRRLELLELTGVHDLVHLL